MGNKMKNLNKSIVAVAIVASFSANATIQQVSTDKFHTLYIDQETKEVAVMGGSSYFNEAGNYVVAGQNTPVPYGVGNAYSVVATGYRSYVLKFDGTVWASGREFGKTPIQLPFENVDDVAATGGSVLLLIDGTVYEYIVATGETIQVPGVPTNVTEVSADFYHCLVKTADGNVYTWGHNSKGQLGDGTTDDNMSSTLIEGVPEVVEISTSQGNSVLTDINGDVWTIGHGRSGMAGNGTDDNELTPYKLNIGNTNDVVKGYAGYSQTMVLHASGQVEMVGWHNLAGQDNDGVNQYLRNYELVSFPELSDVVELDATGDHKMFIQSDGTLITWGSGGNGQLGNGKNVETNRLEYVFPITFPEGYVVEEIEPPYVEPVIEEIVIEEPMYEIIEPTVVEVIIEPTTEQVIITQPLVITYVTVDDGNNGHGNDEDGIDESNPGKSANHMTVGKKLGKSKK